MQEYNFLPENEKYWNKSCTFPSYEKNKFLGTFALWVGKSFWGQQIIKAIKYLQELEVYE